MNEKKDSLLSRYRWGFIGVWTVILVCSLCILISTIAWIVSVCSASSHAL